MELSSVAKNCEGGTLMEVNQSIAVNACLLFLNQRFQGHGCGHALMAAYQVSKQFSG